jgi:hypothetical protein
MFLVEKLGSIPSSTEVSNLTLIDHGRFLSAREFLPALSQSSLLRFFVMQLTSRGDLLDTSEKAG